MKKCVSLFLAFLILLMLFIPNFLSKAEASIIYIDPGHGGFDGGCTYNNVLEKDITLSISLKLQKYLESVGYTVFLTREKDVALAKTKANDIYKRVALINKTNTLIYISIHANSYTNSLVKGAQTFYKDREDNLLLAKNIQDNLKQIDLSNNRVHKPITNKYIVDNITKTGCLVEVGFLSNLEESIKLNSDDYQSKLAYAIYAGILSYLESI